MRIFKILLFLLITLNFLNSKTIKDIYNREINIPHKINKIIAIGPGALRFITYFQKQNLLCGVERIEFNLNNQYRPYWYVVKDIINKLPIISEGGPNKMPYFSKIIITEPDIIIAIGFSKAQANLIFNKTGIPVILLDYGGLGQINENFFNSIKILGKVFNNEKRANELINYIKSIEHDLKNRTKNVFPKTVFVGGIAYKGIHGFQSTDTDLIYLKLINAINIANFSKLKGHIDFSIESILNYDPDFIFIDITGFEITKKQIYKNFSIFKELKAFKNTQVYKIFPYNSYNSNVSLAYISAYYVGKVLYPENFKDINIENISKEIFYNFFKKEINLKLELGQIKWN